MRPLILHVVATLDRGGTEISCLALAEAFRDVGVASHIAAIQAGSRSLADALEAVPASVTVLPSVRAARVKSCADLCRHLTPDAVIFHFFTIDHVLLSLAARFAGVRRLLAVQGNPAPAAERRLQVQKVAAILWASRSLSIPIVSASHWIKASLASLGAMPEGSTVIHNGCDISSIAAAAEAARAVRTDSDAVILMVARLDPIKDHPTLLKALATLPDAGGRRVRLDLVGDGVLRADLEAEAAALGISDRVRFLGTQSNVAARLGAADVFCLSTTRDEGFGIVLIEALAAGVPIVASDVPACREVLEDGALGTLVQAGDATALAAALGMILATPQRAPKQDAIEWRYGAKAKAQAYATALGLSTGIM